MIISSTHRTTSLSFNTLHVLVATVEAGVFGEFAVDAAFRASEKEGKYEKK